MFVCIAGISCTVLFASFGEGAPFHCGLRVALIFVTCKVISFVFRRKALVLLLVPSKEAFTSAASVLPVAPKLDNFELSASKLLKMRDSVRESGSMPLPLLP